jgi:hypothetical protein
MTAINHALTGTIIGLVVGEPLLAIPAAFLSHYICDALPHFGTGLPMNQVMRSDKFRAYLFVEAGLCFLLVILLAVFQPVNWQLAAISAFAAAAPDWLSFNRFITIRRGKTWKPGWYSKFASGIQWFERPIGAVVEVAWFVAALVILVPLLRP